MRQKEKQWELGVTGEIGGTGRKLAEQDEVRWRQAESKLTTGEKRQGNGVQFWIERVRLSVERATRGRREGTKSACIIRRRTISNHLTY